MPDAEYRLIRPNEGLMWSTRMLGMPGDPTHPFVTTTAALPREGAVAGEERRKAELTSAYSALDRWHDEAIKLRDENRWLKEDKDLLNAQIAKLDSLSSIQAKTMDGMDSKITSLRAELAKRDAEIAVRIRDRDHLKVETADLEAKARNLHANLADAHRELALLKTERDETKQRLTGAVDAMMVERRLVEERDATIAELKAKAAGTEELLEVAEEGRDKATADLARAEATVNAVAADLLGWPGEEFADLSDRLRSAFVAGLPTVAEVVAAHDAEMAGATDRLLKLTAKGEPTWLVEETTVYTLDAAGHQNRIYANFQGASDSYKERCELAKRCADTLNKTEAL